MRAEPPSRQGDLIHTLVMRVEKSFALPRVSGAVIGVFGDVFNVTNAGAARNFVSISGPRFGLPQGWIEPRALRMGARVMF